jgi:ribonuclease E
MLDSERNTNETDTSEAAGHPAVTAPAPTVFNDPAESLPTPGSAAAVPVALFQPPQVLFQPPPATAPPGDRETGARDTGDRGDTEGDGGRPARRSRSRGGEARGSEARDSEDTAGEPAAESEGDPEGGRASRRTRGRGRNRTRDAADDDLFSVDAAAAVEEADAAAAAAGTAEDAEEAVSGRRRRRRSTRTRSRGEAGGADSDAADSEGAEDSDADADDASAEAGSAGRRRRRKRRRGSADSDAVSPDDPPDTVVHVREAYNPADDVRSIKGSTRLEAKRQRRREGRESGRRRPPVITESEFLARRESVERTMVVRQRGDRTQIAVLEDDVLVEHYVNRTTHASYVGNVYLGKVQNVLPSMEAAFVDIGKGRNAVLYAGEVNFDASGLEGQPKRIESALKPGQSVIVQVTKDPVGHKGARLTSQVSLPGRYLVYVPGASMTGISRKLPDTERTRLKQILKKVTPENAGVIVRTAAEGAAEAELERDITRLAAQWENIEKKSKTASAPALLYGEPDLTIRVIRDVFNEDFSQLIVSGSGGWEVIDEYVRYVAPHLSDRISRWDSETSEDAASDVFAAYRVDEQLAKALERKVWLPSGGSLVIDRTEAMTVVDVNTGKFTGQGGNLEETVTRNNLEAAEEIVRQLRLRDVGGIVVIDFIDMVLESNRELVLRRLLECLARDRTKHQVAEVTSLGLVQMTRKRVGAGLLEAFSQQCECCNGRGVIITLDAPAEPAHRATAGSTSRPVPTVPSHGPGNGRGQGTGSGNGQNGFGGGRRNGGRRSEADRTESDRTDADRTEADRTDADRPGDLSTAAETTREMASASVGEASGADRGAGSEASGGRRTRRSTSAAGTAFATAVLVEDTPAPVVTIPPAPVEDPAPADQAPAADPLAGTARPRTRTRAGSATARVTVAADPEPATPELAATELASVEVATPELAATELASVEVATPESATPEAAIADPEAAIADPATPELAIPDPVTPEPVTPDPVTPEPVTTAAAIADLATPEPAIPEPVTPEPVVPELATPEAATPEAAAQAEPAPEATDASAATEPAPFPDAEQ